jgi:hypothetical protein
MVWPLNLWCEKVRHIATDSFEPFFFLLFTHTATFLCPNLWGEQSKERCTHFLPPDPDDYRTRRTPRDKPPPKGRPFSPPPPLSHEGARMGCRSHAGACPPPPFYALYAWGLRRKQPPLRGAGRYVTPPFVPALYHANAPLFAYEPPPETPPFTPCPPIHMNGVRTGVAATLLPVQPPPFVGARELKVPSLPPFACPLSHANALLFAHETPPFAPCLPFGVRAGVTAPPLRPPPPV